MHPLRQACLAAPSHLFPSSHHSPSPGHFLHWAHTLHSNALLLPCLTPGKTSSLPLQVLPNPLQEARLSRLLL